VAGTERAAKAGTGHAAAARFWVCDGAGCYAGFGV
jgi:hypothetical protein